MKKLDKSSRQTIKKTSKQNKMTKLDKSLRQTTQKLQNRMK